MLFYDHLSGGINCLLIFFAPEFKINFDGSPQIFAIRVLISIPLKFIDNDLAIVFGTQDDI